ncbi:MAG: Undecaprenyl-diphosphatase [Candidatus Magasanikbacteria bacterium GW2011_GWC2_37_14]|uniref:Undecaprenyl-diphosphatase n=1 Tax=Candidatus Magasanikbacteria bacterium GW2011_GWC2_37_14 TaxID=1619046 RepID=A0A0G0IU40_9BACT|nr:MAG: Undecaprenyl-diphosphatase [Candidatus Magasanikbacteria bacterium GW2011_GWC2_37_14]
MTILHSIILGIVEGITEFLPISSTGHLILTAKLLHLPETNFNKSFEIIIQLGAILAVLVIYWKKLFLNKETFKKVALAFIPTAIIGLTLYKIIKSYLLGSTTVVLWSLLIGGIIIIIFEKFYLPCTALVQGHENSETNLALEKITYKQALLIGLFQSIAIIPGVSRSAATIIGGLSLGLNRKTIVEFSFLLAIPTMAAATGLDLIKNASSFSSSEFGILSIGFVTAFLVAILAVNWFLKFITKHTFITFGIYRIAIAILFFILFIK